MNIQMATDKNMLSFMEQDNIYHKVMSIAHKNYLIWKMLLVPATILQTINIIAVWTLFTYQHVIPESYTTFTILFTATVMSYVLCFNMFPEWLVNWTSYLASIRKQVELDFLLTELTHIKSLLVNHLNGTNVLPTDELTKIKQQGLFLSKITDMYK